MKKKRCLWADESSPVYVQYHDLEWGVPTYDDQKLYEMFLLETFQAGLSWITILKKREAFREAFDYFNVRKIAAYGEEKVETLMQNKGIIRNRGKITAAVSNAAIFLDIGKQYKTFAAYLWGFTDGKIIVNTQTEIPAHTPLSDAISADLKKRGMRYVGTVTIYAYLQAVGLVNDHQPKCFLHPSNRL